jgi:hypothetical protein
MLSCTVAVEAKRDNKGTHGRFHVGPHGRRILRTRQNQTDANQCEEPWQNGIAERWIGSARREMMDHVIPLNERHLRRLGRQYLAYYHENRTHIALGKTTPVSRPIEPRPTRTSLLQSHLASAAFITATVGQKQLDGETTTTHLVRVLGVESAADMASVTAA